jgi:hypothetical protein
MQFGRESDNEAVQNQTAPSSFTPHDPKGWFCSKEPDHFEHAA